MRHKKSGRKLNRDTNHRKLLIRTQIKQLIKNSYLKTTQAKGKTIKQATDKLLSKAKNSDLNFYRSLITKFNDKEIANKIINLSKQTKNNGGYVKLLRLGKRLGDNAMMVRLELIPKLKTPESQDKKSEK